VSADRSRWALASVASGSRQTDMVTPPCAGYQYNRKIDYSDHYHCADTIQEWKILRECSIADGGPTSAANDE